MRFRVGEVYGGHFAHQRLRLVTSQGSPYPSRLRLVTSRGPPYPSHLLVSYRPLASRLGTHASLAAHAAVATHARQQRPLLHYSRQYAKSCDACCIAWAATEITD